MVSSWLILAGLANAAVLDKRQSGVPDYFISSPEILAGPTSTGPAAFLAQTNPAPFASKSYVPPQPLETQVPIQGAPPGGNIYHLHGQLSHYFPNPDGFGVNEYPVPAGANITQLFMLSRHGSRYPTTGTPTVIKKFTNNTGKYKATGDLAFLNNWTNKLGEEILVPVGKQELFDSGVLHQYLYGHLYNNNGSKIIARSTTQDRMRQSAEYFLAGFFGLQWTQNATVEFIIEQNGFNDTLAGYYRCNNSNNFRSTGGSNASTTWQNIYLANALKRIQPQITGLNLTISDVYGMQSLCAYETVALGYSAFCKLFTYEEWEGYEYSVDLSFTGNNGFQSPTGRAVGVGWVEELRARLTHHYITKPTAQINTTLDSMPSTFPLNQSLYFDFSHDTNIFSDLTALGLRQFGAYLPPDHILRNRSTVVSHLTPFGARVDIEVITAPQPLPARRGSARSSSSSSSSRQISSSIRSVTSARPATAQSVRASASTTPATRISSASRAVVTQIGDGQPQAPVRPPITQIGDGQPQAPRATSTASSRVARDVAKRDSHHADYVLEGRDLELAQAFEELHARQAAAGGVTQYVHILISQRTVPLHANYPQCVYRDDGYCELGAFLNATANALALSQYDYACNGNYTAPPYGSISNGAPNARA